LGSRQRADAARRIATRAARALNDSRAGERAPPASDPIDMDFKARPQHDQPAEEPDHGIALKMDEDGWPPAPPAAPFSRRHPWAVAAGLFFVLTLVAIGYLYWQYARQFEATDDAFVDARSFDLAPKISGYVIDVLVTDNQHIDAGTLILDVDPRDYRIAADLAQAQIQSAQAAIDGYDAQIAEQGSQIDQAAAQVEVAHAALRFASGDSTRYGELAQNGAGTAQRALQASTDRQQRAADATHANAALTGAAKQVNVLAAERKGAIASLAQAQAQYDQAILNLSYTSIRAPQAGRITKLSAAIGQYVQPGTGVAMFIPDRIWVTANFKETQLTDMRPGQSVTLSIDAYPDHPVEGRVASIQSGSGTAFSLLPAENATGNYVKVVQRVPVKITVDEWPADLTIGPGMSVIPTVRVLVAPKGMIARRMLAWVGLGPG
jgi:membrane fusion protein (multidrug efflux system)